MTGIRRYHISLAIAFPSVIKRVVGFTVCVYLFQELTGHRWDTVFGLVPALVVANAAIWQLVTYAFLHGGAMHLLWNMLVLWMFGTEIEIIWGGRRFLLYYLVCAVGAAILTVVVNPGTSTVTIGASGAVFGILVAFGALFPDRQVAVMLLFPMKARYFVALVAGLQLLLFAQGLGGVAYAAHLGGLITGAIFLAVTSRRLPVMESVRRRAKKRRRPLRVVRPSDPGTPSEPADPSEIDRILDKISAVGVAGLTDRERTILEQASRFLERREGKDAQ